MDDISAGAAGQHPGTAAFGDTRHDDLEAPSRAGSTRPAACGDGRHAARRLVHDVETRARPRSDPPETGTIPCAAPRPDPRKVGRALGFAALVLLLGAVVTLAAMGDPWVAGVVATTGLTTIVPLFVTGQSPPAPTQFTAQGKRLPTGPHRRSG